MTLPAQLRAIADRLDAAEEERRASLAELMEIGAGALAVLDPVWDDASVLVADEERVPGEGQTSPPAASPSAPIHAPGQVAARNRAPATAAGRPAPAIPPDAWSRPYRVKTMQCPGCDFRALGGAGLGSHRRHRHGVAGSSRGAAAGASKSEGTLVPRKGAETFLCDRCVERFTSRKALAVHRTSHPRAAARAAGG